MKRKKYLVRALYVVDKKDNLVYIDTYRTLPNVEVEDEFKVDKTVDYNKLIRNLRLIKRAYQEDIYNNKKECIGYFARDIYQEV